MRLSGVAEQGYTMLYEKCQIKGIVSMAGKFHFLPILGLVFIVLNGVWADDATMDAREIIQHYKESLQYVQSVSMKIDINVVDETKSGNGQEFSYVKTSFVFRRDHDQTEWIGDRLFVDKEGVVDTSKSFVLNNVMTGDASWSVIGLVNKLPMLATKTKEYKERQKGLFDDPEHGGALFSRIYGNSHKSATDLLAESADLHLKDEMENVNGALCYVLEATTKYGKVTVWIDPERGYNPLRWIIHKTEDDLFDDKPISSNSWEAVFDASKLQKIGETFIITGGNLTHTISSADGYTSVSRYTYKVSEAELNPDFNALGAFKIKLPNGTPVQIAESQIKYRWWNGKIVKEDPNYIPDWEEEFKLKRDADYLKNGQVAPSFTVQRLNGKELKLENYRGKVILLYFWALWCKPCVASTPALKEFYEDLKSYDNFETISFSQDDDDYHQQVQYHIKKYKLTWPQVRLGLDSKLAAAYGAKNHAPVYVLVGPDGKILLGNAKDWNKIKVAVDKELGK